MVDRGDLAHRVEQGCSGDSDAFECGNEVGGLLGVLEAEFSVGEHR
jgi:hypothetical protein